MQEIWKDVDWVKGYEGLYQVSNLGRVKSLARYDSKGRFLKERIKKLVPIQTGYLTTLFCADGVLKNMFVHRLVATAFIPNSKNLPEVNHKDENKQNNCVENLEWCDRKYNLAYGNKRLKEAKTKGFPVYCIELDKTFWSVKEAARCTGLVASTIHANCKGKLSHAGDYHWRYVE